MESVRRLIIDRNLDTLFIYIYKSAVTDCQLVYPIRRVI